jgi:hypothetical protein
MRRLDTQVTHMVNATTSPPSFPGEFEYLDLQLQDEARQQLTPLLPRFLDFVRSALEEQNGCVLIYSDRGVSRAAALAIAWIMEACNLSYYESFVFLKDRRYVINPNHGFAHQLSRWGLRKPSEMTLYQCHCGACVYGVGQLVGAAPEDSPAATASRRSTGGLSRSTDVDLGSSTSVPASGADFGLKPGPRSILVSGNMLACQCDGNDSSSCPLMGCQQVLDAASTKLSYLADNLVWVFAQPQAVSVQDLRLATAAVDAKRSRKGWSVFRCRTCEFVTHALQFNASTGQPLHYALVGNIPMTNNAGRGRASSLKAANAGTHLRREFVNEQSPFRMFVTSVLTGGEPKFRLATPTSKLGGAAMVRSSSLGPAALRSAMLQQPPAAAPPAENAPTLSADDASADAAAATGPPPASPPQQPARRNSATKEVVFRYPPTRTCFLLSLAFLCLVHPALSIPSLSLSFLESSFSSV